MAKKEISPLFSILNGLEDVFEFIPEYELDETIDGLDASEADDSESVTDDIGELEIPEAVTITQRSRVSEGGAVVVDLIIEVEEIDDIVKYDVRVTKA